MAYLIAILFLQENALLPQSLDLGLALPLLDERGLC
jgi:hypothetical protein